MSIVGDIARIRNTFDEALWREISIERWRENYEPLARYSTPEGDFLSWSHSVKNYSQERLQDIRINRSVWLIIIKAQKR